MMYDYSSIQQLLLSDCGIQAHIDAINGAPDLYLVALRRMVERKIFMGFSTVAKSRILGGVLACGKRETVNMLLDGEDIGLAEVLKACQLLDSPRQIRSLQRKLVQLEARRSKDERSVRSKTLAKLRTSIHNLEQECPTTKTSMSSSKCRFIRQWASGIDQPKLEFFLLNYPTDSWRALADIVHFRKTDFQLDYFLAVIFGEAPPEGSIVQVARGVTSETLERALQTHPGLAHCYSFLRKHLHCHRDRNAERELALRDITNMGFSRGQALGAMPRGRDTQSRLEWLLEHLDHPGVEEAQEDHAAQDFLPGAKERLAKTAPLETLIWWYHELKSPAVQRILAERIAAGEEILGSRCNYGKLMERILYFRQEARDLANNCLPAAEKMLRTLQSNTKCTTSDIRLAVLGDASGSMEVAIKCAACLGSLLSATLRSDLLFFNETSFPPSVVPRSAKDTVNVVEETKAVGGTCMAAGLWPYYHKKEKVDLFVLVSDEGENEKFEGLDFAELLLRYQQEVSASAKVVLVSFLPAGQKGKIEERLEQVGIPATQFRLDADRPDTSKFDALLGLVTLERAFFEERFESVATHTSLHPSLVNVISSYL